MQNGLSVIEGGQGRIGPFKIDKEKLSKDEQSLVFPQDLVITKTTEENLTKLLYPLFENRNILLIGDAGVGKNALVYYINAIRNLPTIRFSFNQDTLPEDLVGSFRILPDGFHWQNGPLVNAISHGYTFVADEMNLASPEILKRFISVLENRNLNLLEKDSSQIKAHSRFNFIATQNPSRGFEGRKILPESISRLFTIVYLESYPLHEEIEIFKGLFPFLKHEMAERYVLLQRKIEQLIWQGDIGKNDLEHYHFNIRTGQRFFSRMQSVEKLHDENPDFLNALFAFFVDLYAKEEDRNKALDLIADVFSYSVAELRNSYRDFQGFEPKLFAGSDYRSNQEASLDPLPLTRQRQRTLEYIDLSLQNNENLLLEGEDAARMGELVTELAAVKGRKTRWIHLAKGMHTSEIIGALRPVNDNGKSTVRWIDGPLVNALKNQKWVILDNIEAAGSELIEKLNMLLDHASSLTLPPEAEGEHTIERAGNSRIIAIKRTRKSRNQGTISRAFRNRFFSLQVPIVDSKEELTESATLLWESLFGSLCDMPKADSSNYEHISDDSYGLIAKMVLFHESLNESARDKKIARSQAETLKYREENLLRWVSHIYKWLGKDKDFTLRHTLGTGIEVHYLSALPTSQDQDWGRKLWKRIFQGLPLDDWNEALNGRKKKLLKSSSEKKKLYWNPKKHKRPATTGKASKQLAPRNLKKGMKIDTPETGGKVKEGPDAWYGQDTQGNQGNGEPQGGGGAWGYRTEELFQEFLKKYKPKFDYNLGYQLNDYYEVFGKMLEDFEMDLENALESNMHINRRLASYGSRVEARRYLAYMANKGSDRIFDHSRIVHTEDKLKGLEFAFFINKGRRLFNFHYSVASIVALQSAMEVLWDKKIPLRNFGYSDFDNQKRGLDLIEYTQTTERPKLDDKKRIFDLMSDGWQGDTVEEYQIAQNIDNCFSPDATTRIAVIVSDFRGYRAKGNMRAEIESEESEILRALIKQYSRQNYVFLGMQTGTRYIAKYLFEHSVWINEYNFDQAPVVLAEQIKNLILRYHRPTV